MIHTIKNYKWVIATSLICIIFGLLTFFTFINQGFIRLNDFNLQILLFADLSLLVLFFTIIIYKTFKILSERKKGKLGSETSLRYIIFFSTTTLLPSIIIAIFSLFLFNVGLQKYFDNKIKIAVNNSSKVAENYVNQIRNSIEADISLMVLDVNNRSALYYDNPKQFLNLISSQ
jgi:two-component system nitrogen regulation sensor histidine kinase NtrY